MGGVLLLALFLAAPCAVGAFVGALQRADDIDGWVGEHLAWQAQRARVEARRQVFDELARAPREWFGGAPHVDLAGGVYLNDPPAREYLRVRSKVPVGLTLLDHDPLALEVAVVVFKAVQMACCVGGAEFRWWTFEPTGEYEVRRLGERRFS